MQLASNYRLAPCLLQCACICCHTPNGECHTPSSVHNSGWKTNGKKRNSINPGLTQMILQGRASFLPFLWPSPKVPPTLVVNCAWPCAGVFLLLLPLLALFHSPNSQLPHFVPKKNSVVSLNTIVNSCCGNLGSVVVSVCARLSPEA